MTTAQEIVESFAADAPVNIEGMIEALGVELVRKADLDDLIAGQIECIGGQRFRISVNKNDHYYRRRFTTAHELAHYLLHRNLIADGVNDTKAYRSLDIGNFQNANINREHEAEANRLASRLLMPKDLVRKYHAQLGGNLSALAKKFQVSEEAMGYRLQALNLR